MDDILYFRATDKDIDKLVDLRIIFSDELYGKQPPEKEAEMRKNLRSYFEKEINRNYISWYAVVDGHVAAIAGMVIKTLPGNIKNPSGVWGYIMSVYTSPAHRGKGLCRNVLERLMETAGQMGISAFELHATAAGEPVYVACGFYKHHEPTYRKIVAG